MKGITKEKKIIAGVLIGVVLMLTVAFAAVSQSLKINGTAKVDSAAWDIHFKSSKMIDKKGDAREVAEPSIENGGIDLTLKVGLRKPKDEITYEAVIVNAGDMDAQIERIDYPELSEDQAKILEFEVISDTGKMLFENQSLKSKEEIKVIITVRFKDITDETLLKSEAYDIPLTFKINYIQSGLGAPAIDRNTESILAEGTDGGGTSKFFGGPITKESVEKIKFMPTVKASSDAIGSWDASYKKDNSVIAWYTDDDSNDLYELYIGGYGKVYAPAKSDYLFRSFNKLTDIDFANVFDTSKTITMLSLFNRCNTLVNLNVENFITTNVTNMNYMFYNCSGLINLDLSSFNTEKVTTMNSMFQGCSSLINLDLSNWNTKNVTNMGGMFESCVALTTLNVSNFNTSSVTTMQRTFYNCNGLINLDLSNWNTESVTTMQQMFSFCRSLTTLDVSSFNTSNVTTMHYMFNTCSSLTSLDLSNFNTEKVTNMYEMFLGCNSLVSLDLSNFNSKVEVTMQAMFSGCSSLINLNLSNFNTEKVINMNSMFSGCSSLTSLDLSNWNTENVTNMGSMFKNCTSLTSLNLSNFNTSKINSTHAMFSNCSKLESIDLSSFNTSNVTDMSYMFSGCSSLISLDLNNFNTSMVTNIFGMFQNCSKLESIDLRNADFASLTTTSYAFVSTSTLKEMILSDITVDKYSSEGFKLFLNVLGASKTIYVKDSDCVTAGQSINSNLNYVVYEEI